MKLIDMTGERHGNLTVLRLHDTKKGRAYWMCKCDCGTEKPVLGKHMRNGQVISCGCVWKKGPKPIYASPKEQKVSYRARFPEKFAAHSRAYRERNTERVRAANRIYSSEYRASRIRKMSIPAWSEVEKIKVVFEKAKEFGMEIDHIVPIKSDLVCGLHVWHNLQLLDMPLNRSKKNRYWPDMPDNKRLPDATLKALSA